MTLGRDPAFWAAGLLVFVLSWPVASLDAPGVDPRWIEAIAMHQATHHGLDFGPDVLFTWGPLGFLRFPTLVWPWTARLAFAYAIATHLALALSLIWAIRRSSGSLLTAALLGLLLAGSITQEPMLVVGFIWTAALLSESLTPRRAVTIAAAVGVVAGVELLAKFNTGVTVLILGMTAVVFVPAPRRRPAIAFAVGVVLALVIGWLGTGQPITNVPNFVSGAVGVASGYSEAMGYEDPGREWELWAVAMLVCVGVAGAWTFAPRRERVGLLALWGVLSFCTFKAGFVRHDGLHANVFFATMAGALCAFVVPRRHRVVAVFAGLVAITAMFASLRVDPAESVQPLKRMRALLHEAAILSDGSRTNDEIAAGRDRVAAVHGLDRETYALLEDHTVHVDPVDPSVAWAQRLRWIPVPVFATYSAYTPDLDRRNAEVLADPRGPERVLRDTVVTTDGRNPAFDSPAAMRAMLCHFKSVRTAGHWQVLARVPNRCSAMSGILEVKARFGDSIAVPDPPGPRSAIVAKVDGVEVHGLERLRTFSYRSELRGIGFDGTRGYRLVPGTAIEGLVLRVPSLSDLPAPFAQANQPAKFISFSKGTSQEPADGKVTVRFFSMPIR